MSANSWCWISGMLGIGTGIDKVTARQAAAAVGRQPEAKR